MPENFTAKILVEGHCSAAELLHQNTQLSKACLKDAMHKGAVWMTREGVTKRIRRAKAAVQRGDQIVLYFNPAVLNAPPPRAVLLDDQRHFSLWYKPAGLMCSGTRYGDHHSIARLVQTELNRPTFLVHRLDRFTRGVMVLAHSKRLAGKLSQQFANRQTVKEYQAKVWGEFTSQVTIQDPIAGRDAISHVTAIETNQISIVSVRIETGRKHQIRRHLASLGFPIVGDRMYGRQDGDDLQLVATRLQFQNPETSALCDTQLPEKFRLA